MKKVFFPLSLLYIFVYFLFAFFIGAGFYCIIYGVVIIYTCFNNGVTIDLLKLGFESIVGGIGAIVIFISPSIYLLHNRLIFYYDKIVITGHRFKKVGLQYPDEIKYNEIKNVSLIYSNANSRKKRINVSGYTALRPYTYFEIWLEDDKTKWILVECFSMIQRKKMLQIINQKTGLNLVYNQLEKKNDSIYKKRKKK